MSSSNSPAKNVTTQYGRIPTYLVETPMETVGTNYSAFTSATAVSEDMADALNKVVNTLTALGVWKFS